MSIAKTKPVNHNQVCKRVLRNVIEHIVRILFYASISCFALPGIAFAQAKVNESDYYKAELVPWNTARSFIIYHVDTDRIVAALNPDYTGPVASLTKLMTCVLADELMDYNVKYKLASDEAKLLKMTPPAQTNLDSKQARGSSSASLSATQPLIALAPPAELSLTQLIDLAMVPSNNTVCKVIARVIDGSEDKFADRMTKRGIELGLRNTQYSNSTGLPSKTPQYSTTRDQLKLTLEVLNRPALVQAASKSSVYHLEEWDSTLIYLKRRYPVFGMKTGWTNAAGRCFVLLLEHPKHGIFVIVQLKSSSIAQSFVDAEIIMSRFGLIELSPDALLYEAQRQDAARIQKTQNIQSTNVHIEKGIEAKTNER